MSDSADTYLFQQHIFKDLTVGDGDTKTNIDVVSDFKVKEIRIDFSYNISADSTVYFVVSSPDLENEVVGILNKFSYETGGVFWAIDGFNSSKEFSYKFRIPRLYSGNLRLNFSEQQNATLANAQITVHIQLLG